jgi:hypothetical protein
MNIIYLDLPSVEAISNSYLMSTSEVMARAGGNIGNFVFRKGLKTILHCVADRICHTWAEFMNNELKLSSIDLVIVSCANWLGMSAEDERDNLNRALVIESFDCPVVSFGLGIQASEGVADIQLGPNTVRLAKALSRGHKSLSVRDHKTLLALQSVGISNAIVTGCPSNFINLSLSLEDFESHRLKQLSSVHRLSHMISEVSGANARSGSILRETLEVLKHNSCKYVLQAPDLIRFLTKETLDLPSFYINSSSLDASEIAAIIEDKSVYFTSVDEWMLYSQRFSFSSGMRIHGTMVPLQAGVPSLLVTHDARTSGLAESMKVPTVSIDDYILMLQSNSSEFYAMFFDQVLVYLGQRKVLAAAMSEHLLGSSLVPSDEFREYLVREV